MAVAGSAGSANQGSWRRTMYSTYSLQYVARWQLSCDLTWAGLGCMSWSWCAGGTRSRSADRGHNMHAFDARPHLARSCEAEWQSGGKELAGERRRCFSGVACPSSRLRAHQHRHRRPTDQDGNSRVAVSSSLITQAATYVSIVMPRAQSVPRQRGLGRRHNDGAGVMEAAGIARRHLMIDAMMPLVCAPHASCSRNGVAWCRLVSLLVGPKLTAWQR
jgi:hypothetical protein